MINLLDWSFRLFFLLKERSKSSKRVVSIAFRKCARCNGLYVKALHQFLRQSLCEFIGTVGAQMTTTPTPKYFMWRGKDAGEILEKTQQVRGIHMFTKNTTVIQQEAIWSVCSEIVYFALFVWQRYTNLTCRLSSLFQWYFSDVNASAKLTIYEERNSRRTTATDALQRYWEYSIRRNDRQSALLNLKFEAQVYVSETRQISGY